jgi:RNA polymerase sigma-70 factor (ECF subfamily)
VEATVDMDETGQWLGALYQETGPELLRYLVAQAGDVHAAEDLLQETFAAALRNPDRLRAAGSQRGYLFGIARNLAITSFRRRRENEPLSPDLAGEDAPPDPKLEQMQDAISRLKPEFREPLQLRLQSELSYEEIAETLDIPVGTVRSRLHHAVRELRRMMHRREAGFATRKADL